MATSYRSCTQFESQRTFQTWLAAVILISLALLARPVTAAEAAQAPAAKATAFKSVYSVICSNQNCPDVAGAVESAEGLCSATLVGADLVATNRHCIPEPLRKVGADCNAEMQFILPASKKYAEEKIACGSIEAISDDAANAKNLDAPDWALIRLKASSARKLSEIGDSTTQVLAQRFSTYPLVKNPLFAMAEMQKVDCTTKEVGYLFPHTFHKTSAMIYLAGCSANIVHGNSGAGLFTETGIFAGIVSHMVKSQFQNMNDALIEGSPNGLATRALCLPLRGSVATACMIPPDDSEFKAATTAFSTLAAFVREAKLERQKAAQNSGGANYAGMAGAYTSPKKELPRGLVQYEVSNNESARNIFVQMYPEVEFERSYDFLLKNGFKEAAQEMIEMVSYLLPQVPSCVIGGGLAAGPVKAKLPYEIFSFRDWTMFPDGQGNLFLKTADDLVLQTPMVKVDLEVELSPSVIPYVGYNLRSSGEAADFDLNDNETVYLNSSCAKEQQEKQITRGNGPFSRELITPSEYCQNIYRKQAFRIYVKPFTLDLPSCALPLGR